MLLSLFPLSGTHRDPRQPRERRQHSVGGRGDAGRGLASRPRGPRPSSSQTGGRAGSSWSDCRQRCHCDIWDSCSPCRVSPSLAGSMFLLMLSEPSSSQQSHHLEHPMWFPWPFTPATLPVVAAVGSCRVCWVCPFRLLALLQMASVGTFARLVCGLQEDKWTLPSQKGLLHCWWECQLEQPLWRTLWRFLKT